ncbi:hypothetical protein A6A08_03340 [Nocardiopsis sp. TSRI0078]|uniref:hypothetical protein n=1 Tax=unclassified Nocardiopsis TaxID=2649073 RepID=UPI00093A6889|nr:hypothetical protein [Nocardiopsis sp. TSRI0078]OKI23807.1 hypothetical protein A6A08_03340 [Nocardiopsis sp. TSRI0078]
MASGAEVPDGHETLVGQEAQAAYYKDLVDPGWSGPPGRRRPIMVVRGPQGYGKSHFVRHKAQELERLGIPYAHLDLSAVRYHSSVPDAFAAISSHQEKGLARALKYYGRLQFPRLWIGLITIRLEIDLEGEPEDESDIQGRNDRAHAEITKLVDQVWPDGMGRLSRFLGEAGNLIPPAELIGVDPLPVDLARWVAAVSGVGARVLERVFDWMRTQGQGGQAREQVADSLYHLWLQARDPDAVDAVSRISNREKVSRFLSEALFTDLQHVARRVGYQPTPVLLLDNADQGVGPVLLRSLAEVPAPFSRTSLFGGVGFPEPLTVVATTAETVDGVPLERFYEDTRQYMRFFSLTPLGRRDIGELFSRARSRSKGSGHVSNEIVDLLADFTGGHPGTTAQLAEAWVAVRGNSLHEALSHRPVDPSTKLESTVTVEEHMLRTAIGADPDQLDHRLREALVTCSAARDPDAGLWLNRSGGLTERVEEDRLLAYPLWDRTRPEETTVLRRLLSRGLARRPTGAPGNWDAVHCRLADYYQSGQADSERSAECEIYHRLCAGQLTRVAWHLQGWLQAPDIGGEEWVRLLREVTAAPLRARPPFPLLDAWTNTWQRHAASEGTESTEETETVLKLVAALQILNDPDLFHSGALHSVCHMALNDLAGRAPRGAAHIFEEAAWHLRLVAKFGAKA